MNSELPFISIVIPNYNHSWRLESTLASLTTQSYPRHLYEIHVIDNGSTDGSQDIARQYNVNLQIIDTPKNPYVSRNAGIRLAAHEWIALLDATCIPGQQYLEELVKTQKSTGAELVIGNIVFEISGTPTLGEMIDSLRFMRNSEHPARRHAYPGGSLFFARSLLTKVSFFREDMRSGADIVWTSKVIEGGHCVAYAEEARVYYAGAAFPGLLSKAHRDGWGQGVIAREDGSYHWFKSVCRMRPPSPWHMRYIMKTRGTPMYRTKLIRLWGGLWLYRIFFNIGYLNILRSISR